MLTVDRDAGSWGKSATKHKTQDVVQNTKICVFCTQIAFKEHLLYQVSYTVLAAREVLHGEQNLNKQLSTGAVCWNSIGINIGLI